MKIFSFVNNKGGQGKSTSALCVAHYLVLLGHRVLLIDADPQANSTQTLDLDLTRGHLGAALSDNSKHTLATLTQQPQADRALYVVPADPSMEASEKLFGMQPDYAYFFAQQLEALQSEYDFVVIDSAPSMGALTMAAMGASQAVFVPMTPDYFGSMGLRIVIDKIARLKKNINKDLRVGGIFFTKYANSYRKSLHRQYAAATQDDPVLAGLVMEQSIRDNVALAESQSLKQSIYDYAPASNGAQDYTQLTDEILLRLAQ